MVLLKDGRIAYSDPAEKAVVILDADTLKESDRIPVENPSVLAVDKLGVLWMASRPGDAPIITGWNPKLRKKAGSLSFLPATTIAAMAFDKDNRLLLADGGKAQQVYYYDKQTVTRQVFGELGGTSSNKNPGVVSPLRFVGLTGVGADDAGNVYVSCNQPGGGTVLRSFAPGFGALNWELLGLEFVDGADAAAESDGADVWTVTNRYTLDWTKPAGKQWTWRAQTVDTTRFPDDPRVGDGHDAAAPLLRTIKNKKFLVVRGQYQGTLGFYQVLGDVAKPSAMIGKSGRKGDAWAAKGFPAEGRWIWRDTSGKGDFNAGEFFDADGTTDAESWAWWVDDRGDVWQGQQDGTDPIRWFPCQGLDGKGNPVYTRASMKTFALPAPMNLLLRMEYHAKEDVMFLSGHTTDRPKTDGEWGQAGTELWRINDWAKGNRVPVWRAVLPYKPETAQSFPGASATNATIKSVATALDYCFAVESRTAKVHVYDAATGKEVGVMTPGAEVFKESGWVDFPDAIRAVRRKSGEYLVFVEEDWKGKILVYRWTP